MQNLLTFFSNALILKIAFVIIRRLQKPHYSSKTKTYLPKTNKHKKLNSSKNSDSGVAIFISQGHSTTEFGVFCIYTALPQNGSFLCQKSFTKSQHTQKLITHITRMTYIYFLQTRAEIYRTQNRKHNSNHNDRQHDAKNYIHRNFASF